MIDIRAEIQNLKSCSNISARRRIVYYLLRVTIRIANIFVPQIFLYISVSMLNFVIIKLRVIRLNVYLKRRRLKIIAFVTFKIIIINY